LSVVLANIVGPEDTMPDSFLDADDELI